MDFSSIEYIAPMIDELENKLNEIHNEQLLAY